MTDDLTAAVARLRLDMDILDIKTDVIGSGIAHDVRLVLSALEAAQAAQRFAGKILAAYADNWATDLDGATLEDWADECGLMEWIVPAPDGSDRCRNCEGDPCEQCHRYTDTAQAAIDAAAQTEQTSGPGVPCESPRSEVSATTSAADGNVGTEDATSGTGRIGRTAPGPLDPQNGVQRDAASPGCALGASSLESGNAREATCLSGDPDARQPVAYTAGTVRDHAGSTPAAPTDPIADLCAELRATHCSNENLHDDAADALERMAREIAAAEIDRRRYAMKVKAWIESNAELRSIAERAEAERDALRECVRAADAMALECKRVGLISSTWLDDYDDARAKVKL